MLPELNDRLAIDKEFLAILESPYRVIARCFKAGLDIVSFDGIPGLGQFRNNVADFFDHQISGEVAINFVDLGKSFESVFNPRKNPLGRFHQLIRAATALFQQ